VVLRPRTLQEEAHLPQATRLQPRKQDDHLPTRRRDLIVAVDGFATELLDKILMPPSTPMMPEDCRYSYKAGLLIGRKRHRCYSIPFSTL